LSRASVLRITALRAFSLRGRPGPRATTVTAVAFLAMSCYSSKNKSDTHRIASIFFWAKPDRGSSPRPNWKVGSRTNVDCRFSTAPSVHLCGDGSADPAPHAGCGGAHAYRHFSRYRHPGHQRGVGLPGAFAEGHGGQNYFSDGARPHHSGGQHRAHRVAVSEWPGGCQNIFPSIRQYSDSAGASDRDLANGTPFSAA